MPHTIERWVWDLIQSTCIDAKLNPPVRPSTWETEAPARRRHRAGRPSSWTLASKPPKTPKPGALRNAQKRALLIHRFFHHELQAAELMGWALLAFPNTPIEFRRGLLRICDDEIRHAKLYRTHLHALGFTLEDFPFRDWFWERFSNVETPTQFVALMGIGFEGANLDHSHRFAELFAAAGDTEGARIQHQVGVEEVAHVRFAKRWFEHWEGPLTFERWKSALPAPLTPIVMRGRPTNRQTRTQAGFDAAFLDALDAYTPHA